MNPLDYKSSGVDIDAADVFLEAARPFIRKTFRPEVLSDIGGFGALFSLDKSRYREPVLVASTDGVGTKLKIAFMAGIHDTVGIDLVAMCVNDIVVQGAEPLFFLDYMALGKLEPSVATDIVRGVAAGCSEANCSLIGGETAELPGMYPVGEYDLAGFCVGIAEKDKIINGSGIAPGDVLIGLKSSGLHSNGYSLVRKLFFDRLNWKLDRHVPELSRTLVEELLTPTRIYVKAVLDLMEKVTVKGIAHITGGGITDNLPRVLPMGLKAVIEKGSWTPQPIFGLMKELGEIEESEMYRVFNNGIGMIIVVEQKDADDALSRLAASGEKAVLIGRMMEQSGDDPRVEYV